MNNNNKLILNIVAIIGYAISFWIPLLGIGLWVVMRKSNPKIARNNLIAAGIGFVLNYGLSFLYQI